MSRRGCKQTEIKKLYLFASSVLFNQNKLNFTSGYLKTNKGNRTTPNDEIRQKLTEND